MIVFYYIKYILLLFLSFGKEEKFIVSINYNCNEFAEATFKQFRGSII